MRVKVYQLGTWYRNILLYEPSFSSFQPQSELQATNLVLRDFTLIHSVSRSDDAKHFNSVVTLLGSVVLHVSLAGLEGSCQDPGFDRNIVQDMGKPQNFLTDTGFDRYSGSGISRIHT